MKIELAGCVIVDDNGRMLLRHRSSQEKSQWELPGGKVERGEVVEQAAVRDLREELGVEVRLVLNLGNGEFENDENEYVYHWFQAEITAGEPTLMESDIFDDFDYFELEDMMSLALSANMHVLLPKIVSEEVAL